LELQENFGTDFIPIEPTGITSIIIILFLDFANIHFIEMNSLKLFVIKKTNDNHQLHEFKPLYCSMYDGNTYLVKCTSWIYIQSAQFQQLVTIKDLLDMMLLFPFLLKYQDIIAHIIKNSLICLILS
jgi:hypothetical protein